MPLQASLSPAARRAGRPPSPGRPGPDTLPAGRAATSTGRPGPKPKPPEWLSEGWEVGLKPPGSRTCRSPIRIHEAKRPDRRPLPQAGLGNRFRAVGGGVCVFPFCMQRDRSRPGRLQTGLNQPDNSTVTTLTKRQGGPGFDGPSRGRLADGWNPPRRVVKQDAPDAHSPPEDHPEHVPAAAAAGGRRGRADVHVARGRS